MATVTSSLPGSTSLQGQVDYGYDHKRQLTLEDSDRNGGYSDANTFDGAGNATSFRNAAKTYNADNQLTGPGTYVYDGNGNPTTWSGTSLTFDVENRMTAYGTALTAGYRGDGLRAWKNTASGQTYFLYDGISVVCELDASGNVSAGSTYGAAGLLSRGSVQYQFDNLGDVTIRLDGSGNVLSYRLFDAWGNELSGGTEPYGYRARYGYYADAETGLIALAYRYYAPGVGRFLNRDPIGFSGGISLYAYAYNSPIYQLDPSGTGRCEDDCGTSLLQCEALGFIVAAAMLIAGGVACVALSSPCDLLIVPFNAFCQKKVLKTCLAKVLIWVMSGLETWLLECAGQYAFCLALCPRERPCP